MNELISAALKLGSMAMTLSLDHSGNTSRALSSELHRQACGWGRYARLGAPRSKESSAGSETPSAAFSAENLTFRSYGSALQEAAVSSDVAIAMLAKTSLDRILQAGFLFDQNGEKLAGIPASLRVDSIVPSGREAAEITFSLPSEEVKRFTGRAGQYITLHTEVAGIPLRRSYSLCRTPKWTENTQQLVIGVRAHAKGSVSKTLVSGLNPGDQMLVAPPNGALTFSDTSHSGGSLVLIGVGSGVTPLVALAAEALDRDISCRVFMIVVERRANDIMLPTVFAELTSISRFHLVVLPTRGPDSVGRPDRDRFICELKGVVDKVPGAGIIGAYLCGPTSVLNEAVAACLAVGINEASIHQETFQNHTPLDLPPRPGGTVAIELGGAPYLVDARPGETLLAAGLRSGADLPYSCLAGSCGTCAVRVTKGSAGPQSAEVLGTQKSEAGWVLACMAAPLGEPALVQG
ncbi:iron-sulfur cluster-binding domain-containing protein [Paenarthrobacter nitroguajacolicus]|uniref:flavin reductase family protein n=1 Tax=Paenarthrobacter nitroguajacolicus TaxID=211146 RepID=UPI00285E1356|nr:iron-sulfur cluster-binding domain-containing protein [Paenarthrobacter nitroguajacolicus]MDR6639493.1 ring-1,2-phenylacetyl-CoA epoxidase subunit PaaE [Paenarthrobacter nitroguajacolicus]